MPEVQTGMDSSPAEVSAVAEESAKVEAARAELYDEAAESSGLILGKYQSVDDLASAYQSLQAEYSRLKGGVPQQQQQLNDQEVAEVEDGDDDEEEEEEPRPQVDRATQEKIMRSIFDQTGGEAGYQRLAGWASRSLPQERLDAYNDVLNSGNEGATLNALKGLQYDFMMSNGYEPKLSGGRAPSSEVKAFSSVYQMKQAMKDPRYEHDAGYRKEVEQRVGASPSEWFS